MDSVLFYKMLSKIADSKSITKAAENMAYTQSGLSHIVNRFEKEMGFKLFLRSKTGVTLSNEGQLLLPIAKEIEQGLKKMDETIASIRGLEIGRVTVGAFASVATHILPSLLMMLGRDYPGIKIDIKKGSTIEIHNWIMDHTVDVGFTSIQGDDEFEYIELFEDPLLAVVPNDFELNEFDVQEFNRFPFIMPTGESLPDRDIDRVIRQNNLQVNVSLSSMDWAAIISMVESGLGISLMPELMLRKNNRAVKTLPIKPHCYRTLAIACDSFDNASPAVLKVIEYAKQITQTTGAPLP